MAINLSIIIPAYREGDRIGQSLDTLATFLRSRKDYGEVEVVVVASGGDDTAKVAKTKAKEFKHFQVLDHSERVPKGLGVRYGMIAAQGTYKLFMDADLSTPLDHLDEVVTAMEQGSQVIIGIRHLTITHKGLRKFISQFGNILVQTLLLPGISDSQCGFKAFEASAAQELFSRQRTIGWGFDMEVLKLARKMKYKFAIIDIDDWKDPKAVGLTGDSSAKVALQVFRDLLIIRINLLLGKYRKPNIDWPKR
jgi:glycosyltransferase involved in cell wall biosynthesis